MGRCQRSEALPLLLSETTVWVGLYGTVGGRAGCWNPKSGRLGSKSLGLVEWGMGCEMAVEQVPCRRGQVAVVVGCACRSMVVE